MDIEEVKEKLFVYITENPFFELHEEISILINEIEIEEEFEEEFEGFEIFEEFEEFEKIKELEKFDSNICYYCGQPSAEIEHVIPRSKLQWAKTKHRVLKVNSCFECNRLLSNSFQSSLRERKMELKRRLFKKYKKLLNMPYWKKDEINELGSLTKQDVKANSAKRENVIGRLKW